MRGLQFDPSKAVTFDLDSGLVHLEGGPSQILVPASALRAMCAAAGPVAAAALGREMGVAMGQRLAARLALGGQANAPASGSAGAAGGATASTRAASMHGEVRAAALDTVVDHLGGELALAGLGSLSVERWGRALVVMLDEMPLGVEAQPMVEALIEGVLGASTGRPVRAALLGHDGGRTRFLLAGEAAVARVRVWLAEGMTWGDVLVKLHGSERGAA